MCVITPFPLRDRSGLSAWAGRFSFRKGEDKLRLKTFNDLIGMEVTGIARDQTDEGTFYGLIMAESSGYGLRKPASVVAWIQADSEGNRPAVLNVSVNGKPDVILDRGKPT